MKVRGILPVISLLQLVLFSASCAQTTNGIFPGADERSPSRSQYFSWINHTNEGPTEEQTLRNLEFFQWLQDRYGMVLDLYAFDAGTIDGRNFYGSIYSDRFKRRFPNGLDSVHAKASLMGTRLGVWGGPDGFGNTKEDEVARTEMMVTLCRDYNFGLFKFDAVCGFLRPEKQEAFANMMVECRMHTPDLILLNHRLDLGPMGNPHSTTFLLGGAETYIDVHMASEITATHHRVGTMNRELTPRLTRLTEDQIMGSACLHAWIFGKMT